MMNIDLTRLRKIMLPFKLRTSALIEAIMGAMHAPIIGLQSRYSSYYSDEVRRRGYNGQVRNLRRALADELGCDEADIVIGNHADREYLMLYDDTNDGRYVILNDDSGPFEPVYSDEVIAYTKEFTVSVPDTYTSSDALIRGVLDTYKLATTRYTIIYRNE